MWTLDMQFNADKGLGWSIKSISKLENMEYLHICIQCAFFQICKNAFLRNAHYAHKPNRQDHWPTLEHIHHSAKYVIKKGNLLPKSKDARTTTSVLYFAVHLGLVRKRKSPHVNWLQYKAAIPTPSSVRIKETSLRLRLVPCW